MQSSLDHEDPPVAVALRRHVLPSQHWAAIGLPSLLCVALALVMHSPVPPPLLPSSTQTPKVGKTVGCSGRGGGRDGGEGNDGGVGGSEGGGAGGGEGHSKLVHTMRLLYWHPSPWQLSSHSVRLRSWQIRDASAYVVRFGNALLDAS